jgi:hypothetical protein
MWSPNQAFCFYFLTNVKEAAVLLSVEITLKKTEASVFHGDLFSWHQAQNLILEQFSNPCLAVNCVSRNTCFNEEYSFTGWKLHVQ